MKPNKHFSLMLIAVLLSMGCSGAYGKYRRQSESESKLTIRELIDNWSDHDISVSTGREYKPDRLRVIIFDPKNDDKKILAGSRYHKVKNQQMWTEIVKENTTSDGEFIIVRDISRNIHYPTFVSEILGLDNYLYGFFLYKEDVVELNRVEQVDDNTVRVSWGFPRRWGGGSR